jgi:predicted metalloprotease with PDZ domain
MCLSQRYVDTAAVCGLTQKKTCTYLFHCTIIKSTSQVKAGGNAQKAGLKAGDVIVRLSGTFDEVVNVAGLGIDKIKSLVAGRPEERLVSVVLRFCACFNAKCVVKLLAHLNFLKI